MAAMAELGWSSRRALSGLFPAQLASTLQTPYSVPRFPQELDVNYLLHRHLPRVNAVGAFMANTARKLASRPPPVLSLHASTVTTLAHPSSTVSDAPWPSPGALPPLSARAAVMATMASSTTPWSSTSGLSPHLHSHTGVLAVPARNRGKPRCHSSVPPRPDPPNATPRTPSTAVQFIATAPLVHATTGDETQGNGFPDNGNALPELLGSNMAPPRDGAHARSPAAAARLCLSGGPWSI